MNILQEVQATIVEAAADFVHNVNSPMEIQAHGKGIEDTGKYDSKREDHVRDELGIWVAYKEEGASFDPDGKYICGTCDMRLDKDKCTHVDGDICFETGGCRLYIHGPELEGKPPLPQKLTQIQADYSKNEDGFGCHNCEYDSKAKEKDKDGRTDWCSFWGVHVESKACCGMFDSKDMEKPTKDKDLKAASEVSLAGNQKGSLWNGIKITGFDGPQEEGLRAMLSRIPPELFYNVKEIKSAPELNAKHGRYIPDGKIMLFNPDNFKLRQRFGQGDGWLYHPELTVVHEIGHSIYESLTSEQKQQWLDLSGWKKGWSEGQATAYQETRPGWGNEISIWTHLAGVKFPRHYSERNPNECFADCFSYYLLGKAHQMDSKLKNYMVELFKEKVKKYSSLGIESPTKPYGTKN